MKTPVAAAISIAGVLVAGSAAALVNSQVFESAPNQSGASAAVLPPPSSVEMTIPEPAMPVSSDAPPTTVERTAPASTVEPATGMLTAFEVGDAGVVTVDVIEGRLVFVSAEASPGWTIVEQSDDDDDEESVDEIDDDDESTDEIEVVFQSSTMLVEFEAELIGGRIVPEVESHSRGGASTSTLPASATSAPPVTIDDGDDDDQDEGDDRDDRDEDDGRDDRDDRDDDDRDDRDDGVRDDDRDDRDDDDSDDDSEDDEGDRDD